MRSTGHFCGARACRTPACFSSNSGGGCHRPLQWRFSRWENNSSAERLAVTCAFASRSSHERLFRACPDFGPGCLRVARQPQGIAPHPTACVARYVLRCRDVPLVRCRATQRAERTAGCRPGGQPTKKCHSANARSTAWSRTTASHGSAAERETAPRLRASPAFNPAVLHIPCVTPSSLNARAAWRGMAASRTRSFLPRRGSARQLRSGRSTLCGAWLRCRGSCANRYPGTAESGAIAVIVECLPRGQVRWSGQTTGKTAGSSGAPTG